MPRRGQISREMCCRIRFIIPSLLQSLSTTSCWTAKKASRRRSFMTRSQPWKPRRENPLWKHSSRLLITSCRCLRSRLAVSAARPIRSRWRSVPKEDRRSDFAGSFSMREDDVGKTFCRNHRCARKYRRRGEEERRNAQDGRSQQSFRAFQILIFQYRSHLVIPCI